LTTDTSEGRVGLGQLGQYLKRTDPGFSPEKYRHSVLLSTVQTYPDLTITKDNHGGHSVSVTIKPE
jgi:hypothetical protein